MSAEDPSIAERSPRSLDPERLLDALELACRVAHVQGPPPMTRGEATLDDVGEVLLRLLLAVESGRPPRPPSPSTEHARRILSRVAAGLRDTEVAAELGTTAEAVRSVRNRYGVPGQGTYVPERSGWEEQIRELHARGLTTREMVRETGWKIRTVQQRLWRLKLPAHRERRGAAEAVPEPK